MARFQDVSEEDLAILLEKRDSLSTKNVIKGSVKVLIKYCDEKSENFPAVDMSKKELDSLLLKFYPYARTEDGKLY